MKKTFLLLIAFLFATTLNAQVKINFGPKVGYQSMIISNETYSALNAQGNITAGAFARFNINNFVIQPELMYTGYKFSEKTIEITNHSIASLPINIGYQIYETDMINIRAAIGPSFYFNVKDKFIFCNNELDINDPLVYSMVEGRTHQNVVIGLNLSVGVDICRFTIDFNYNEGLTSLFNEGNVKIGNIDLPDSIDNPNKPSYKQDIFTITVGYKIR